MQHRLHPAVLSIPRNLFLLFQLHSFGWFLPTQKLELSFLCLSSPLVLCAASPHSLHVNQVKDNEVLRLLWQLSSTSTSFLCDLFIHKPAFVPYLSLPAWKHILCHIWPSPSVAQIPFSPMPLLSNSVLVLPVQTNNARPQLKCSGTEQLVAFPCASRLCRKCNISSRQGCCSLLLRHWWPIFVFPRAVQRQKKVRPSEGVLMINWSLLPVPECRLELERAGSPSWIHRKQLGAFLISSSSTHLPLDVWMSFKIPACFNHIKATLALDAAI